MNKLNIYFSLLVMALTIYCTRLMPFLFLRKPIKNRFFKSFLYYVPYVTLAVMTFPSIITATGSAIAGWAALIAGLLCAFLFGDLFVTACVSCLAVLIVQYFI